MSTQLSYQFCQGNQCSCTYNQDLIKQHGNLLITNDTIDSNSEQKTTNEQLVVETTNQVTQPQIINKIEDVHQDSTDGQVETTLIEISIQQNQLSYQQQAELLLVQVAQQQSQLQRLERENAVLRLSDKLMKERISTLSATVSRLENDQKNTHINRQERMKMLKERLCVMEQLTEPGEANFKCTACDIYFNTKSQQKEHSLLHMTKKMDKTIV